MKRPKWMKPHVLDELDAKSLRKNVIEKGVFCDLQDSSPDAIKRKKRIRKLWKIMTLEHEACGEENW
jgi:hypothetical protein